MYKKRKIVKFLFHFITHLIYSFKLHLKKK